MSYRSGRRGLAFVGSAGGWNKALRSHGLFPTQSTHSQTCGAPAYCIWSPQNTFCTLNQFHPPYWQRRQGALSSIVPYIRTMSSHFLANPLVQQKERHWRKQEDYKLKLQMCVNNNTKTDTHTTLWKAVHSLGLSQWYSLGSIFMLSQCQQTAIFLVRVLYIK